MQIQLASSCNTSGGGGFTEQDGSRREEVYKRCEEALDCVRLNLMTKIVLALSLLACGVPAIAQQRAVYADSSAPVEARITDLLSRMTLDEKVDAFSTNPTVARLGVVGTGHVEGLHGLALGGPGHWEGRGQTVIPTTTFPQSRGLGQTWDPSLLTKAAAQEAYETRYALGKYHRGGLVVRAPNADLSRDPRWGRSEESYGEDPFLVGTLDPNAMVPYARIGVEDGAGKELAPDPWWQAEPNALARGYG